VEKLDISKVREMIKKAHRPETVVRLCLRGDLQAELEMLEQQLRSVPKEPSSLADSGQAQGVEIIERMREIAEQMEAEKIPVRLRAFERREWYKLVEAHPPRKDDVNDRQLGVNRETFFDEAITKAWMSPELEPSEIKELLDLLTSAQFQKLQEAVWNLNRSDVDVPFSPSVLRTTTNSERKSRRRRE
jgi:hypothetical protein